MAKTRRLPMTAGNMLASLGKRKTVTRRVMRPQPAYACNDWTDRAEPGDVVLYQGWPHRLYESRGRNKAAAVILTPTRIPSPYGETGGPLALTETWRPKSVGVARATIEYRADGATMERDMGDRFAVAKIRTALQHGKWLPPMFMQAWASRAPAVVKSIRAERVQGITDADALAEGVVTDEKYADWPDERLCACPKCDGRGVYDAAYPPDYGVTEVDCAYCDTAVKRFRILWDSINEKRGHGWGANDWVWAVEYERTDA